MGVLPGTSFDREQIVIPRVGVVVVRFRVARAQPGNALHLTGFGHPGVVSPGLWNRRCQTTPRPLLPGSSRNWATHPLEVNAPTVRPGRLRFRAAFCRVSRHAPPTEVSPTCAVRLTGRGIWPVRTLPNPKSLRVSASHPARRYSRDSTSRGSATRGGPSRGDGDFERKLDPCDANASTRFA